MRNLASVQIIKNLESIENSTFLDKATILGWTVVVEKGQFLVNDLCIFFEIDSLLPDELRYEFLKKNSWNEKIKKYRLKTSKFRGTLSQGLAMPIDAFPEIEISLIEGTDLTDILKIEKYEPSIPLSLAGDIKSFSWPITKTDEARIQTDPENFISNIFGKEYYITTKIDGTSASFILTKDSYSVCSRNNSLKEKENNAYWKISNELKIKKILEKELKVNNRYLAIQGEIAGPGIQANKLNLEKIDLFVFNIVNVYTNKKLSYEDFISFCRNNELKTVPVIEAESCFNYKSLNELLEVSKGKYISDFPSTDKNQDREGIVIRTKDQSISFKVINNDFLLKNND